MDLDSYHSYMAAQRARAEAIRERADRKLARLGGGTSPRRSAPNLEDLSAEELDRDSASIRNVMRVWRRTGKHANGISTISLPSGRILKKHWNDNGEISRRELAVSRNPKHLKKQKGGPRK